MSKKAISKSINKQRRKFLKRLALLGGATALSSIFLSKAAEAVVTSPTTVERGSLVAEASYVIFIDESDGNKIKARNGATGKIDYSGTDAATVINNALGALTAERTWKETVVLKGDLTITAKILIPSYTKLQIEGQLNFSGLLGEAFIVNENYLDGGEDRDFEIEICGGIINGNRPDSGGNTYDDGINFGGVTRFSIHDMKIMNVYADGIDLDSVNKHGVVENIRFENMGFCGIHLHDNYNVAVGNCVAVNCAQLDNTRSCFDVAAGAACRNVAFVNCHAYTSPRGFQLCNSTIVGCSIYDCTYGAITNGSRCDIIASRFIRDTATVTTGVQIGHSGCSVVGCLFEGGMTNAITTSATYGFYKVNRIRYATNGIVESGSADYNIFEANTFWNVTTEITLVGSNSRIVTIKQMLGGSTAPNLSTTTTEFMSPVGRIGATSGSDTVVTQVVIPFSGTIKNLYVKLAVAPGTDASRTFALTKNTVVQGLSVTISGTATSGSDTTNSFTVVAGDVISLKSTVSATAPAASTATWGLEIDPT